MNGLWNDVLAWLELVWRVMQAVVADIGRHWLMASFSLVAGFGVWFAIQDVENPRVDQIVPLNANQGIVVEAVNVPANYIFQPEQVRVRVEAREQDIDDLVADDFEATVDLTGIDPTRETEVEVNVRSNRDDVRVVEAVPAAIRVRLLPAETREMQVVPRYTGALPEGYRLLENDVDIDPAFVNVTGTTEQLDSIASVGIDVSLNGRRDATSVVEGELVARTASGNSVTVKLNPDRAKVTLKIEQTFSQRALPVVATLTGDLPCCYRVAAVNFEPQTVLVTGPKNVVDNLTQVTAEQVDIAGATSNIQQVKQIVRIPNTSMDRTSVVVRVAIEPINCAATPSLCSTTVRVPVDFENAPPGLTAAPGSYFTDVRVTGPPDVIARGGDFQATVSLINGSEGVQTYPVTVAAPPDVRVESATPVTVELIRTSTP